MALASYGMTLAFEIGAIPTQQRLFPPWYEYGVAKVWGGQECSGCGPNAAQNTIHVARSMVPVD